MSIKNINKKFSTQKKCVQYLEKIRWNKKVISPYTGGTNVTKRKNSLLLWRCNDTKKDFSVLQDTIFEHTRLPLTDWFMLIQLILNAKKGISASQLSRDLGISYKTAWYSAMRVRCGMIDNCIELENIVEMDEAYVGGKPRKPNNVATLNTISNKRGRGTKKTPIVGISRT